MLAGGEGGSGWVGHAVFKAVLVDFGDQVAGVGDVGLLADGGLNSLERGAAGASGGRLA